MVLLLLYIYNTVGAVGCNRDLLSNSSFRLNELEVMPGISEKVYFSDLDPIDNATSFLSKKRKYGLLKITENEPSPELGRIDSATSFPTEDPSSTISFRSTAKTDKGPSVFSESAFETKEDPSASSGEESAPTDQDESVLSEDDRKTPDPDVKWIGITVIVIILFGPPILILIAYTLRRYERVEPENGEVAGPSEPC